MNQKIDNILVVEDEDDIRDILTFILTRLEKKVFAASTPQEALELVCQKDTHFDLVITDFLMPGMSGAELVKKMIDVDPSIQKVIFITGMPELLQELEELTKSRLQLRVFFKPFQLNEISDAVVELLKINN